MSRETTGDLLRQAAESYNAGRFDEAMEHCRSVLRSDPGNPASLHRLGLIARARRDPNKALELLHRAARIDRENAELQSDLGKMLLTRDEFSSAISLFELSIRLDSTRAEDYACLAYAYRQIGRSDLALGICSKAFSQFPDDPRILERFTHTLMTQGQISDALEMWRTAAHEKKDLFAHASLLLCQHYSADVTAEEIYQEHLRFAGQFEKPLLTEQEGHLNSRDPDRLLRVGYVTADCCNHPVAQFLLPLLRNHDRVGYQAYCYSATLRSDEKTLEFKHAAGERWRDILKLSDQQAVELIRRDQIDVLVDAGGHTAGNRLLIFARRPAPVQVTWLGYPDTTGFQSMDYRITDSLVDPPGLTDRYHTETLFRLPDGFLSYEVPKNAPAVTPPPHQRNGFITFGSFNNFLKFSAPVLKAWAAILQRVGGSKLMLKHNNAGDQAAQTFYFNAFESLGIERNRILISPVMREHRMHLDSYAELDIALDPFPYNGTTTTVEALAMGVPLLTLEGQTHVSRVGLSLLNRVGLQDWVASSDDYVALAVRHAGDREGLARLRGEIRGRLQASPLGRPELFARRMEDAYRAMWRRWAVSK